MSNGVGIGQTSIGTIATTAVEGLAAAIGRVEMEKPEGRSDAEHIKAWAEARINELLAQDAHDTALAAATPATVSVT